MTSLKKEITMLKSQNMQIWAYRNHILKLFFIKLIFIEIIVGIIVFFLREQIEVMVSVWVILGIGVPFIILKPHKLFKVQWVGRIEKISYVQRSVDTRKTHSSSPTFYTDMCERTFIECLVIDSKNNTHIFEAEKRYDKIYNIGDHVINIIGFYSPINLTSNSTTFCPKCGTIVPASNDHCTGCGLPPLKTQNQ